MATGSGSIPEELPLAEGGEVVSRVSPLTELELLKWENELLRREKQLNDREKLLSSSSGISDRGLELDQNASNLLPLDSSNQLKMGVGELRTIIEEFNPSSNRECDAKKWTESIEGLRNVYGWDERITLLYATLRLGGAASYWYQSRQDGIKTFADLKREIVLSFPSGKDDSAILVKIMQRKRLLGEPIEDYLYQIAALGKKKIDLSDATTIKYIIGGLSDQHLIDVLLASKCTGIPELLQQIKNYEEVQEQKQSRRNLSNNRYETSTSKQSTIKYNNRVQPFRRNYHRENEGNLKEFRAGGASHKEESTLNRVVGTCFKCNKTGHYARNCPSNNTIKKCFHCHHTGHLARDCKTKYISKLNAIRETEYLPKDETMVQFRPTKF